MSVHRENLPQLDGDLFLTDAGLETHMVFHKGLDLPCFAAHTLLAHDRGRAAMTAWYDSFLSLALEVDAGFILDIQVWRAHPHFASALGVSVDELRRINHEAAAFAASLRRAHAMNPRPIVLSAAIGPRGDAYTPEALMTVAEARAYHGTQAGWLAETDADMISGLTFTNTPEAAGLVLAARDAGLPVAISFTLETNGCLPSGQPLGEAIEEVDALTASGAVYFMVNCAHPDHFRDAVETGSWRERIRGLRCNASRLSHAELDECEALDEGDIPDLASGYLDLLETLPQVNIVGGCCGTDLRHVTRIARAVRPRIGAGRRD